MKVYVAGASSEIDRAEKWMAALRAAGIEVTSTWPEVIRKVGAANPLTASREDRALWSATDLAEVSNSEALWLLLPPKGVSTSGMYVELGYGVLFGAMAQQARGLGVAGTPNFWLLGSGTETSIFTALADHFPTDEEAFRALTLRFALVGTKKSDGQLVLPNVELPGEGG
jgi:hypothetical protein